MKRYLGCLGLLKPETDLIRTILRTSSRLGNVWELAESGECDALLVYNADKSVAPFTLTPSTQLIMIRRRGEHYSGPVFYKPFRADDIVDTLASLGSIASTQPGAGYKTQAQAQAVAQPAAAFFRLQQWPAADLLAQHKHYMLLAVYLSRGAKTLQDLMTLSGQSEALCQQFLQVMQAQGLLRIDAAKAPLPAKPVAPVQREKKSFFSLLKAKLELNKNNRLPGYERI